MSRVLDYGPLWLAAAIALAAWAAHRAERAGVRREREARENLERMRARHERLAHASLYPRNGRVRGRDYYPGEWRS